jgi:hypothetical protein
VRRVLIDQDESILILHQHIELVQNADDLELLGRAGDVDRFLGGPGLRWLARPLALGATRNDTRNWRLDKLALLRWRRDDRLLGD